MKRRRLETLTVEYIFTKGRSRNRTECIKIQRTRALALSSGWLWFIEGYPDTFFLLPPPHFLKFSQSCISLYFPPNPVREKGQALISSLRRGETHGKSSDWPEVKLLRGGRSEVVTYVERELRKLWSAAGHVVAHTRPGVGGGHPRIPGHFCTFPRLPRL